MKNEANTAAPAAPTKAGLYRCSVCDDSYRVGTPCDCKGQTAVPAPVAGDYVAMQPVAEVAMSDDGYKIGLLGPLRAHRLPLGTKLYASPQAALAQDRASQEVPAGCATMQPGYPGDAAIAKAFRIESECAEGVPHASFVARVVDRASQAGVPEVSATTQALIDLLRARDAAGRAKYGATLDRGDLSHADWLQHMAEEMLDGAGYALAAKRRSPQAGAAGVPECLTCGDRGWIGGPTVYDPGEGGVQCPDCDALDKHAAPTPAAEGEVRNVG